MPAVNHADLVKIFSKAEDILEKSELDEKIYLSHLNGHSITKYILDLLKTAAFDHQLDATAPKPKDDE